MTITHFSDAQINEIMQEFWKAVGHRQYIGARYVPIFGRKGEDSVEWDNSAPYEALTIVLYQGNSFTSKQPVPAGVDIANTAFWAETGNYNAQIEQYRNELLEYKNQIPGNVKVIFMPNKYKPEAYAVGSCTVFKTNNGKTLMIDAGANDSYMMIKNELSKNGITHIDYFILTHYHADHYENCENMVNDGYIDSATSAYIPKSSRVTVSNWGDEDYARQVLSICGTVIEPNSNTLLEFDGVKVSFFNCNEEDINYYDSTPSPNCNYYSICNYIEYNGVRILMTGDILRTAQQYLYEHGYIKQCDIMLIPHHMNDDSCDFDFILAANPAYAIASQDAWAYQNWEAQKSAAVYYLNSIGCKCFITAEDGICVGIGKGLYTVMPNGIKLTSSALYTLTLHVNKTYAGDYCNGSSMHPFKSLQAAINYASELNTYHVQIAFTGNYESDEEIKVYSAIPKITIQSCTVKSIRVENSCVDLKSVHVNGSVNRAIYYLSSTGYIEGVINDGDITNASSVANGSGMYFFNSNITIYNATISNKRCCINANSASIIRATQIKGINNEYAVLTENGNHISILLDTSFQATYKRAYTKEGIVYGSITNDKYRFVANLVSGADLNDYIETGTYLSTSYGMSQSLVNAPGAYYSGALIVMRYSDSLITQEFETTNYSDNYAPDDPNRGKWVRTFNGTNWSNWAKQY